ncbi:MAG: hypothetical protein AB7K71_21280 [Polyangiaceae bacterium]
MTEAEPETSWRKVTQTVFSVLAVAVALNFVAGRCLERYSTNLGYRLIAFKWRLLGEQDTPVDMLILGDSAGNQGYNPEYLRQRTGSTGLNLATLGNFGLVDDEWMLEEYVERVGTPKRLLLIHVYDAWYRRPQAGLFGVIPRWRAQSAEAERELRWKPGTRYDLLENRLLPLYSQRQSLRDTLEFAFWRVVLNKADFARFRARDSRFPEADPVYHSDGYVEMCGALPRVVAADVSGHIRWLSRRPRPRLSGDNVRALQSMIAIAEKRDITLSIVPSPIANTLATRREFKRYVTGLDDNLRRLTRGHPKVQLITERFQGTPQQMQNADHLACEAVPAYMDWVAAQLKAADEGPADTKPATPAPQPSGSQSAAPRPATFGPNPPQ